MYTVTSVEFVLYQVVMFGLPLAVLGAIFIVPPILKKWERDATYGGNLTKVSGNSTVEITVEKVNLGHTKALFHYEDFDRPLGVKAMWQIWQSQGLTFQAKV